VLRGNAAPTLSFAGTLWPGSGLMMCTICSVTRSACADTCGATKSRVNEMRRSIQLQSLASQTNRTAADRQKLCQVGVCGSNGNAGAGYAPLIVRRMWIGAEPFAPSNHIRHERAPHPVVSLCNSRQHRGHELRERRLERCRLGRVQRGVQEEQRLHLQVGGAAAAVLRRNRLAYVSIRCSTTLKPNPHLTGYALILS